MGATIRILPEGLVRLIRAGEVVERPASAVKELVENSIDAGARNVGVRLEGAGRSGLGVTDDGRGMTPEDLSLCTMRHATSKIPGTDLSDVVTLGFRGEALAALSAVGTLEIRSRSAGQDCGWRLGSGEGPSPCAFSGTGTEVSVAGLFARHPARLKGLRSDRHETALARRVVEDAALCHPGTAFTLDLDGRRVLDLRPAGAEARARDVMGRRFSDNCVAFSLSMEGATASGLVALPSWAGQRPGEQRICINGRPVRDRTVSSALRAALHGLTQAESPSAFVDLRLPPGDVDVNAHAAKAEVRLASPGSVFSLVRDAVAAAVGSAGPLGARALSRAAEAAARPVDPGFRNPATRVLGEPMGMLEGGKYMICRDPTGGLVVVDVHAAAERISNNRMVEASLSEGVAAEGLPSPLLVHLGAAATAAMEDRAADLELLGLRLHALDDTSVVVTAVPSILHGIDAVSLVETVARDLLLHPEGNPLAERLERLCALMSCHASLRTGDDIPPARQRLLLRELEATPGGSVCLHGRPTSIAITEQGFDKLFGRL